tara:strand:- start:206 stop:529 length:324 start_codon:yes stop_codon:yes gene_type:complete
MECVSVIRDSCDLLEELKNNTMMPNFIKIKTYKDYLVNEKKYYYPDMLIEWIAREHLGLQRSEEEIKEIRNEYLDKVEKIEEENKLGEIQLQKIEEANPLENGLNKL